jgi:hypothetical protein
MLSCQRKSSVYALEISRLVRSRSDRWLEDFNSITLFADKHPRSLQDEKSSEKKVKTQKITFRLDDFFFCTCCWKIRAS